MASKAISVGVGIPMIVAGALIAIFLPQYDVEIASTIEFIGSLIGTLGVVFFISGLFYAKHPFQILFQNLVGVNLAYRNKSIRKDIRQDVQRGFLSRRKFLHPLWR